MALVHMIYYVDVLSSWCHVADHALERVRSKYGDDLDVEWRVAQLFEFGALPFTREQLQWYYARTAQVSGIQMSAQWHDSPHTTTVYANEAAEAARMLGANGDALRLALSRAALIDGKPLGHREAVVAEAARLAGLEPAELSRTMETDDVKARIRQTTREFEDLALTQRPSFVMRSTINDLAVFSGLYTFESFDAVVGEMIRAARINRDYGAEPV